MEFRDRFSIFDNESDELGFDWGSVIGAGINIGGGLLTGGGQGGGQQCAAPAGCFQCRMVGRGDIAGCIDRMLVEFENIYRQGNAQQSLQTATAMLQALNDDRLFAQNTGYAYLGDAKARMQREITRLQGQIAAAGGGTTTVINPATGQQMVITAPTGGIDTTTLLLLGGGLALILLLKR